VTIGSARPQGSAPRPRERAGFLVVATTNANKVAEMKPVLAPVLGALGLELRPVGPGAPDVVEDCATFAGNAAKKALAAAEFSGLMALAEDSGLEVEALDGAPGVRSARYSGLGTVENNRLLLDNLDGVPEGRRNARFRTVAVIKVPGGPLVAGAGSAEGEILTEPRGEGGFGYDPVFRSRDLERSFAEVGPEEKRRVSHRSRALRAVRGYLFEVAGSVPGIGGALAGQTAAPSGAAPVPGHAACLAALARVDCPAGLVAHQLAVGRVSREMALLLAEAGQQVDPALAAAAGLLHDVGRVLEFTGGAGPGSTARGTAELSPPPEGVTPHALSSAAWATARGLDPRLVRAVLVHGLDSLASAVYFPRTWEERIVMLADKMVEDSSLVGVEARLTALRRRYPFAATLADRSAQLLARMEAELAAAGRVSIEQFRSDLAACLRVVVLPPDAGVAGVEAARAAFVDHV